jgi:hypothetical protein
LIVTNHDDERSLVEARAAGLLREFDPVGGGHGEVEHDDIKFLVARISGGGAFGEGQGIHAVGTEHTPNQLACCLLVAANQCPPRHFRGFVFCSARKCASIGTARRA